MQESGSGEKDVAKESSRRQEHFNPKYITEVVAPPLLKLSGSVGIVAVFPAEPRTGI